jgi:acyl-CoA synthetase (AMP-forming)/AMP-acid ligase II
VINWFLGNRLLTLPFILLSMTGGHLANRWSKRTVTIGIKVFEILVMGLAMLGLMVLHTKVEERLHELAGSTEQTFVVAGVPDEKKGERLVVLHELLYARLHEVLEKLSQTDLPNLWKPRADQFFKVDSFPLLGTGKSDLRKVRDTAAKFANNGATETAQVV